MVARRLGRAASFGAWLAAAAGCNALAGIDEAELACRVDGRADGAPYESDVDCGGACPPCADLKQCFANRDCVSGTCYEVGEVKLCLPDNCDDSAQNGEESDVNCGGSYCDPCGDGLGCRVATDCTSGVCSEGICQVPTCGDFVANGAEPAIDCGGDCGPTCPVGSACFLGTDCSSGVCNGVCLDVACGDGVQNGEESDIDCGGALCGATCVPGDACNVWEDCNSYVCTDLVCAVPTCFDGVPNGNETAQDCGGAECGPTCPDGMNCETGSDCLSFHCNPINLLCATTPGCGDGVLNQDEVTIDCGGGCGLCSGEPCRLDAECKSGDCDESTLACL